MGVGHGANAIRETGIDARLPHEDGCLSAAYGGFFQAAVARYCGREQTVHAVNPALHFVARRWGQGHVRIAVVLAVAGIDGGVLQAGDRISPGLVPMKGDDADRAHKARRRHNDVVGRAREHITCGSRAIRHGTDRF